MLFIFDLSLLLKFIILKALIYLNLDLKIIH